MKLFDSAQIRSWDQASLPMYDSKEEHMIFQAAQALFPVIKHEIPENWPLYFLCGPGNNGADGLALAALLAPHYVVTVLRFIPEGKISKGQELVLQNLNSHISWTDISDFTQIPPIPDDAVIVDALLGTGSNRPLNGAWLDLVQFVNQRNAFKIAIDIPSGLPADIPFPDDFNTAVQAQVTLTIAQPKRSFFFPESYPFVGNFKVIPLSLSAEFTLQEPCNWHWILQPDAAAMLEQRSRFAHKGTCGHALLVGGELGKAGAIHLAAKASLRAGVGLTTIATVPANWALLQQNLPEAMIEIGHNGVAEFLPYSYALHRFHAIGLGPGLGKTTEAQQTLKHILQNTQAPLVLDADALNILSENLTWLSFLPPQTILTPHPKEFDRLTQSHDWHHQRIDTARKLAAKTGAIIVLKNAYTTVITPAGNVYVNSTGNQGMATGGSGDVLTGILTALLAQGYSAVTAAVLGVYLHGLAGDLALHTQSMESLIASDIIANLGGAFKQLHAVDIDFETA